jgi:hypothetical protein
MIDSPFAYLSDITRAISGSASGSGRERLHLSGSLFLEANHLFQAVAGWCIYRTSLHNGPLRFPVHGQTTRGR